MKTKHVLRYHCDHCGKGRLSKSCMVKHEIICVYNPTRQCPLCWDLQLPSKPMPVLIEAIQTSMAKLREVSEGCPACILAAIIQSRDPYASKEENWVDFDYKKELANWHQQTRHDGSPIY